MRKYSEKDTENVAKIREVLKSIERGLDEREETFWMRLRKELLVSAGHKETNIFSEARGRVLPHHEEGLKEVKARRKLAEKKNAIKEIRDYIKKYKAMLTEHKFTSYQLEMIVKAWYYSGATVTFPQVIDRAFYQVHDTLLSGNAAFAVWSGLRAIAQAPEAPETAVLESYRLHPTHPDKTDSSGLNYYHPFDTNTGQMDLTTEVSMTPEAVAMRTRKYSGPKRTAEQYQRAKREQDKRHIERGEEYVKKKQKQREEIALANAANRKQVSALALKAKEKMKEEMEERRTRDGEGLHKDE